MPTIYVKPAPGGRVRMPERGSRPMPAEGAWVPRIDYYERLLISGDVKISEPPAPRAEIKKKSPAVKHDHHQAAQPAATVAAGLARSAKES